MSDNSKRTGAAIEAHYQFLVWLMPTIEKLPKSHKFTIGDRVQNTALVVIEALIEATYTCSRWRANLVRATIGPGAILPSKSMIRSDASSRRHRSATVLFITTLRGRRAYADRARTR
jgi:hypothetical protein